MKTLLLLTLLLLGCGNSPTTVDNWTAQATGTYNHHPQRNGDMVGDPQLVSELYTELDRNLSVLGYGDERFVYTIQFEVLDPQILGVCYTDDHTDHRYIAISEVLRDDADQRATVLLHEMGHCLWAQEHYGDKSTPDVMNAIESWTVVHNLDAYRTRFQERIRP